MCLGNVPSLFRGAAQSKLGYGLVQKAEQPALRLARAYRPSLGSAPAALLFELADIGEELEQFPTHSPQDIV